ncbi:MAG: hypothetical protein IJI14_19945 [Anaerolineaceae bacterium]|nr:hypothetical protein [Anaerolineaceae bacterium]
MSVMGESADEMEVRLYSMTKEKNIPLFYADLASVNANISEEKLGAAVELLNIITGTDLLVRASSPANEEQSYQYLLSARKSVYNELGQKDNIYSELETIVSNPENRIFNFRNEDLMSLYNSSLLISLLRQN